jgi:hypothetical protein
LTAVASPAEPALAGSRLAHSPQKRSPGSLAAPQLAQVTASGAAHWAQNLRPGLFSVPQDEQIIPALGRDAP